MKKDNILLLVAVLAYSYLFYQQYAALNVLIFNLLLIGCQLVIQPALRQEKTWLWVAICSLITSINLVWHNSSIAFIAHIFSLVVLAGIRLYPNSSLLVSAFNAVYSLIGSLIFSVIESIKPGRVETSRSWVSSAFSLKLMVPPALTVVFFFIYRIANPAFAAITDRMLDGWPSGAWILFTFLGFVLLFSFFYPIAIEEIVNQDLSTPDGLSRKRSRMRRIFKLPALKTEYQLSWLSFALLNGLVLFVNLTDAYYLLIARTLPEGVIYSEYVHQGIYSLIFSIILAISVILYFFRGNLNFYQNNRPLKVLAYGWIIQNFFLVVAAAIKTSLYVSQYGLTHKRIGVFIYLLLTVIGLCITYIKIYVCKNNWFIFRKTSWAFYAVFVVATFVNWNRIITDHNLSHVNKLQDVDINYLITLPDSNTDQLMVFLQGSPEKLTRDQQVEISRKKALFLNRHRETEWQSWNYDDMRLAQALK
ncbi:DUF4173 domain-containing protein [Rhodocytophaga rosea]|uniref:DUF4173 domain-containing protein n=1 Tax=Rhodocytophaga rosea TaxID=2704465 RepID=A0A6C0GE80_9BACT|nr:DUF4173 domain-containing protein [Rhodocytophaga rosea]QHT66134.1 DUF4173 domain-containing protein [Rhodocytophaga rosea]